MTVANAIHPETRAHGATSAERHHDGNERLPLQRRGMSPFQILASPGALPTILLTTGALHYAMFGHGTRSTKTALVAITLLVSSLLTAVVPASTAPRENLMPGLGETILLAICGAVTLIAYALRTLHRRRTRHF